MKPPPPCNKALPVACLHSYVDTLSGPNLFSLGR